MPKVRTQESRRAHGAREVASYTLPPEVIKAVAAMAMLEDVSKSEIVTMAILALARGETKERPAPFGSGLTWSPFWVLRAEAKAKG